MCPLVHPCPAGGPTGGWTDVPGREAGGQGRDLVPQLSRVDPSTVRHGQGWHDPRKSILYHC